MTVLIARRFQKAYGRQIPRRERSEEIVAVILMVRAGVLAAGDVDWPYRQENNFYYLTGIAQAGSFLAIIPGGAAIHQVLFLPPSNPAQENWTGHILTPAEGRAISGIEDIWDARRFPEFLSTLIPQAKPALAELTAPAPPTRGKRRGRPQEPPAPPAPIPVNVAREFAIPIRSPGLYLLTNGETPEYRRERELAASLAAAAAPVAAKDPAPFFSQLRIVKSQREIDLLQHAVDITAEAFERAFARAVPGTTEYEIQAQFELTFIRRDAHWGYPCIIGAGANSTTLHYETNRGTMSAGDVLLMDAGAEFDGYSADVTRTIPAGGTFTREQADIYRLVWAARQAALAEAEPGHPMTEGDGSLDAAAVGVFKDGLLKLGLITDPGGEQYAIWFNHGIGHSIGLNVHDAVEISGLQPGMVVTIKPGLYIRPNALDTLPKTAENEKFVAAVRPAFERYKGIGVRIEDDVLITNDGPRVMTSGIPARLEEVEAAIARLRRAARTSPLR